MELGAVVNTLKKFRKEIYAFFTSRCDASMELVDALSGNLYGNSVVSLSLAECYRRNYCSITRSLDEFYKLKSPQGKRLKNGELTNLLASYCPEPIRRSYYLFGVDCTPAPRVHSDTVEDRSFVHQTTKIIGNKPITIGHEYSILMCLPDKLSSSVPPWAWPLSCQRVRTEERGALVGMRQINKTIKENQNFKDELCVSVADSAYSSQSCLNEASQLDNLVHISRLKNNRVMYRSLSKKSHKRRKRGRPKKYGNRFSLKDGRTWGKPQEEIMVDGVTKKGKPINVHIECWEDMLLRGRKDVPMWNKPFRAIRIRVFKPNGDLMFKRPLWLSVIGKRRGEVPLNEVHENYRQRFDLEHFFRFGKNRLLMDKYQTPDVNHEEAWWQMVMLSYSQLYLARHLSQDMPKPWEKYLPQYVEPILEKSPSQVQNDFGRIIREIGTPAKPPKGRKKSRGRQKGERQIRRERHPVIQKRRKSLKSGVVGHLII